MKIHYAGEVRFILPGWAACCSGDRAVSIREKGNHSYQKAYVTCKTCIKRIDDWEQYLKDYPREVS